MEDPLGLKRAKVSLVIVGGGPAGLAPLFAAASQGTLDRLLDGGVVVLEEGDHLGSGSFTQYAIRSDSAAEAFLDIVVHSKESSLSALVTHPAALALKACREKGVQLSLVSKFLEVASEALGSIVAASRKGAVLMGACALSVTQTAAGLWRTRFFDTKSGKHSEIESHSVLLATGATEPKDRLNTAVGRQSLLSRYEQKIWLSHRVLVHSGIQELRSSLGAKGSARIVILGGSSSAGAVAHHLLRCMPEYFGESRSITLMHRSPLRMCYESVSAALLDKYEAFSAKDVCPLTGRVFRFKGLRLDSKELFRPGLHGDVESAHPNLTTCFLPEASDAYVAGQLDEADLIITAFGYRPRFLPIYDAQQLPIGPASSTEDVPSWVDQRCQLLSCARKPLSGLFATGLAVGPTLDRSFGGEEDFKGQVNSLWLWQHTLGHRIVDEVLLRWTPMDSGLATAYIRQADQHVPGSRVPRTLNAVRFPQ